MRRSTVLGSLNSSLHDALREDERVLVLGEDLLDPYGGAFKVTRGLSTAFPDRVLTTPISEAGFTGVAVGMAMRGLRPVVEIMFGDFLTLAADQLLNHAAKYAWMYASKVSVPLVVRAPMGGRRGYGPTHSQSIEKHFIGMPGLEVVAAHPFCEPGALLRSCIDDDRPTVFIENKLMYARALRLADGGRLGDLYIKQTGGDRPAHLLSYDPFVHADVTIAAYGGMAEMAVSAAERLLLDEEIVADVVLATDLSRAPIELLGDSLSRSGRLLTVEEGGATCGWGAELISQVSEHCFALLQAAPVRVCAREIPIANSRPLEEATLPQVDDIVGAALALTLPSERS